MSLRDQLRDILPEILPENPSESVKGTELIRLVKYRLDQDYSDATLRYHFSIMCCDPTAPIAKVEQGQGYYLRAHAGAGTGRRGFVSPSQPSLGQGLFDQPPEVVDLAFARARKFRAIVGRLAEAAGRFAFPFDQSFSDGAPFHHVWKYPDIALVDWYAVGEGEDGTQKVDRKALAVRQAMGLPAVSITTVKLKMNVDLQSAREDFFQCLSHAAWANAGELAIAAPIPDQQLADEFRMLGAQFGIGITTYGLDFPTIDDLPDASIIAKMEGRELDALQGRLRIQKLSPATNRIPSAAASEALAKDMNADIRSLMDWIARVLETGGLRR